MTFFPVPPVAVLVFEPFDTVFVDGVVAVVLLFLFFGFGLGSGVGHAGFFSDATLGVVNVVLGTAEHAVGGANLGFVVALADGIVRLFVEFIRHPLAEFLKFFSAKTAGEFVTLGFHQIVQVCTLFSLELGCIGNISGIETVLVGAKFAKHTTLRVSFFDGLDDEVVLFLVDGFLFVGVAGLIDQRLELVGEFIVVFVVLVNQFVDLLEEAFVRRSGNGAEEPAKPTSLLRHGVWVG